jgi:hypothetical protein
MKAPLYSVTISDRNTGNVVGTACFTVAPLPILDDFDTLKDAVMSNFINDPNMTIPPGADLYFSSYPIVCN